MTRRREADIQLSLRHEFGGGFFVDISIESHSRSLALFGPSGSGKSTALHAIAGLFRPAEGHIRLAGRVLYQRPGGVDLAPRQRRVGLVVQDALLFPLMTVRENLLFGAPPPSERQLDLGEVSEMLEIEHLLDRRPRNLSGGERQRVSLGRAVLSEPDILLCDEPFSALDAARRDRLCSMVARIRDDLEIPLFLVSHSVSEVLALADEVVLLEEGRVIDQGRPTELLAKLAEAERTDQNVWEGVVIAEDGEAPLKTVDLGPCNIVAPLERARTGNRVRLAVAPRHVSLARSADPSTDSARNRLDGRVVMIADQQGLLRVTLDCAGVIITSLLTREAASEMTLAIGSEASATFKASAIDLLGLSR
jgi:molybdate transport system ATP-binding protein